MCGVTGFLDATPRRPEDELMLLASRMADRLRHRGPDDAGVWVDGESGFALGFRRLSIIDLSANGHQPMVSSSGRYVIGFNGEIYNHNALRRILERLEHKFRGRSDTEVMLAAIDQWGLDGAVARFNGMFAFALWDRRDRRLYLARDRLGEKPMYHGWIGRTFFFGSELKALGAHPEFVGDLDQEALALFLRHKYVPAPFSIYRGIRKLPPASVLTVDPSRPGREDLRSYWSAEEVALSGVRDPVEASEGEVLEELDALLGDAVRLRMEADVPLGVFLSGGVDSSTVTALMQVQADRPVRTFTIGFFDAAYNEAHDAARVAHHLGTDHTELYVTPEEARAVIPRLPEVYDEPFADSSQIPTFLVSELARRSVKVSLSGDGGDEVFGG
jgi:asparagine synthase (glutamine-hydrolysing)